MKLHRFFVSPETTELTHDLWIHDKSLIKQWQKVLRFRQGSELVLFDGESTERLYVITELGKNEAHLEAKTDFVRKLPDKDVYLIWAVLKKDKNEWLVQKCTELGVNHFVPVISERCAKTGINTDRLTKIATEASEQCGRSNIPKVREPMTLEKAVEEFSSRMPLYACEETGSVGKPKYSKFGLLVGPEGGWTDAEIKLFTEAGVKAIKIAEFTLRAETAAVAAAQITLAP